MCQIVLGWHLFLPYFIPLHKPISCLVYVPILFNLLCVFFKNKLHVFIWKQHRFIVIEIMLLFVCYIFWPLLKPSSGMLIHACYCIPIVSHLIVFMLHLFDSFCISCNLAFLLWYVSFEKCCIMAMNIKCNINILPMWMSV